MAESNEALGEPTSLTTKVNIFLLASVPLAIIGAVFAGVTNSDNYRSTSRFMVEPAPFVNRSEVGLSPMPQSPEFLKSILVSDRVTSMAFSSPRLRPTIHGEENCFDRMPSVFQSFVEDSMYLEHTNPEDETGPLVLVMHVDHSDKEVCQAVSEALLESLQAYFNENRTGRRHDQIRTTSISIEQLRPRQLELKNRYRTFKRDAPLHWTSDGKVVNPYRQEMDRIQGRLAREKDELAYRKLQLSVLEAVSSGEANSSDSLPEKNGNLASRAETKKMPDDEEIPKKKESPDRNSDGMKAKIVALQTIVQCKKKRITELQEQLVSTRSNASRLAQYEQEEKAQRRQIERNARLLEPLEVEMQKLSLHKAEKGIRVIELNASSPGYLTGVNRRMWCGAGLGAGLGFWLGWLAVRGLSMDSKRRRLAKSSA